MCVCGLRPLLLLSVCLIALHWSEQSQKKNQLLEQKSIYTSAQVFVFWKKWKNSPYSIINSNNHLRHLSPSSSTRCVISAQFPRQASLHCEPSVSPFSVKAAANPISSTRLHLHPHLQLWMNEWNESIRGNCLAPVFILSAQSDIPLPPPPPPPTLISFSLFLLIASLHPTSHFRIKFFLHLSSVCTKAAALARLQK